ncbi:Ku protein [Streptomyces sp. NPDC002845]
MARAIWTGVITFGMVSAPVGLFTAMEDHTVHFHQLQRNTADRIRNRRVNERTGKEVPAEALQGSLDKAQGAGEQKPSATRRKKTAGKKAPSKAARASATGRRRGGGKSELRQSSKTELYQQATEHGIEGRSRMSREELVDALARVGRRRKKSAA